MAVVLNMVLVFPGKVRPCADRVVLGESDDAGLVGTVDRGRGRLVYKR